MINYTWKIEAMDVAYREDTLQDVVKTVYWRYIGVDSEDEKFTAQLYGSQAVQLNDEVSFIPYSDLTQDIVVGWLEEDMDVIAMQENISAQIELLKNPTTFVDNNPFNN